MFGQPKVIELEDVSNTKLLQEPYAWMVYALASFLDDAPRSTRSTPRGVTAASNAPKMGNWITQAREISSRKVGQNG